MMPGNSSSPAAEHAHEVVVDFAFDRFGPPAALAEFLEVLRFCRSCRHGRHGRASPAPAPRPGTGPFFGQTALRWPTNVDRKYGPVPFRGPCCCSVLSHTFGIVAPRRPRPRGLQTARFRGKILWSYVAGRLPNELHEPRPFITRGHSFPRPPMICLRELNSS